MTAGQIFDADGHYLGINADGSLNLGPILELLQLEIQTKPTYDSLTCARVVTVDGTDTYIAIAPAGSDPTDEVWQAQKIDTNGTRTWADGDIDFDNAANDLPNLTYS